MHVYLLNSTCPTQRLKKIKTHAQKQPEINLNALIIRSSDTTLSKGAEFQGIVNLSVRNGSVDQGTRIVSVHPVGAAKGASGYLQRRLPNEETRSALLGNYLLSEGKPGKVRTYSTGRVAAWLSA